MVVSMLKRSIVSWLYENCQEENAAQQKRRKAEEERKEHTEKAFAEWMQSKALSEQAVKYLEAIETPTADSMDPAKAEEHWLVSTQTFMISAGLKAHERHNQLRMLPVQDVGKRLKAVDENLFKNWVDWSKGRQQVASPRRNSNLLGVICIME